MIQNKIINPEEYSYDLPQDRIALFPAGERDHSKLLFYHRGKISHHVFTNLAELVPPGSILVFNNTRVIPARLLFQKSSGARIEIFLLNPVLPTTVMAGAMKASKEVVWKCMIGNLKRWHDQSTLQLSLDTGNKIIDLNAGIEDIENGLVKFSWEDPSITFSQIIELAGKVPLPPYIHREPVESDKERYQTIYSRTQGAVASSTAGLHFTDTVMEMLKAKNISMEFVTLHISAGTFQPIKTENALDHEMHSEQVIIRDEFIDHMLDHTGPVIAVGTTSMRTLESVYWYGTALLSGKQEGFTIKKFDPYSYNDKNLPGWKESFQAVKEEMKLGKLKELSGETTLYILPGYRFRVCQGLITNYHLPGSTLILLVAAFAGNDWKRIYTEAIMNDYRFLSYGDASLIIP